MHAKRRQLATSLAGFLIACGCDAKDSPKEAKSTLTATSSLALAPSVGTSASAQVELVDLVHRTTALIVSSSHADANSRVEFLVDELTESAWRPNPPDPAPWVELQLAQEAEVHSAAIDLALDDAVAGVALDSDLELQSPQLGAAKRLNDRYVFQPPKPVRSSKLRFIVVNNAKRAGRSKTTALALRELQVRGKASPEFVREYALPEGRVHRNGPYTRVDNAAFRSWWRGAPYQDKDQLCAAYEKAMGLPVVEEIPNGRKFAFCEVPEQELAVDGTPPPNVRAVRGGWIALSAGDSFGGESASLLFVETSAGWSPANLWSDNDSYDGMCPGMHVSRAKIERTFWEGAVLAQERGRIYYPPTGIYADAQERAERAPSAVRSLIRCDTTERLTCREHVLAYGKPRVEPDEDTSLPTPFVPETWAWERSFTVANNGWLRLSPCRSPEPPSLLDDKAAPSIVPCFAPDASRLP